MEVVKNYKTNVQKLLAEREAFDKKVKEEKAKSKGK